MAAAAHPEVVDAALIAVADGATQEEAARLAGVNQSTVSKWVGKLEERLQMLTARIRTRAARKVLRGLDGMVEAQMAAASNPEARHGPQSMRVCMESIGAIGNRSTVINGDVNTSYVNVAVAMPARETPQVLEVQARTLRNELGAM